MEIEPKPQYEIREATIDDIEAIREMHAQSWRDTYQNDAIGVTEEWLEEETRGWLTDAALEKSREKLGACFADPTQFYRIALRDNEIVGLLHLDTNEDGSKHLWGLYTAKDAHGTGLAQQLMTLANEWIGDKDVDLEVVTYNERAKAFYRKYGFKEVAGENELFKGKLPNVTMMRKARAEQKKSHEYVIEQMQVDDIEEATEMRLDSWLDTYVNEAAGVTREWIEERNAEQLSSERIQSRKERFEKGMSEGTFNAWVAKASDGTIIGSTTPFIDADGRQRVGSIYVDKKWHGTGVGSQLMQRVIDWFDDEKPIELGVVTYNERAKAFYRKWGFEEIPDSESLFDGKIPEVKMIRKPLS